MAAQYYQTPSSILPLGLATVQPNSNQGIALNTINKSASNSEEEKNC
jgi:hypothetical protein